jgi:D-threo-aldose 1-dehydrogenase
MKTRLLGRTGLDVSEIIFGCGNVGGLLIQSDADTMRRAVRRALDLGINWFDTAALYGDGQSEENLGRLLNELDDTPHVSTKVRLAPEDMADIPAAIERNTLQSLSRLNRESVDLLQIHNRVAIEDGEHALSLDSVLGPGGVADALVALRKKGLTQFIGFTALGETEGCRQVVESGRFDTVQVYYNVINPTAARPYLGITTGQRFTGLIESCRVSGVGVIVIRSMAAGVIASATRLANPQILTRDTDAEEEYCKARAVFDLLGDTYGTRAQTALRFALTNPDISCIDIGPSEIAHIEEAAGAASAGPLSLEAMARLESLYQAGFTSN